jgi:hypothetical protein
MVDQDQRVELGVLDDEGPQQGAVGAGWVGSHGSDRIADRFEA